MPAKRAYGMDQDFYPWSPIVARPVLRWPEGARVALAVIVNLEHWDWEVPAGTPLTVSPMGGPEGLWSGNQPQFPDIGGWGNHEYGNRVGIFRILAVLDKYGITPTLALDKAVADHYPTLVEEASGAAPSSSRTGCRAGASSISACPRTRSATISGPRSRRSSGRPARARSAGQAPISRRPRTPPICSPPKAFATSATWAMTSSPTG